MGLVLLDFLVLHLLLLGLVGLGYPVLLVDQDYPVVPEHLVRHHYLPDQGFLVDLVVQDYPVRLVRLLVPVVLVDLVVPVGLLLLDNLMS